MGQSHRHARLALSRGDVVVSSAQGDYGKPRAAGVVQSDLYNGTHSSVVVCPMTSELAEAPLFRLTIEPMPGNGLSAVSQVVIDKVSAVRLDRIGRALLSWLGLEEVS